MRVPRAAAVAAVFCAGLAACGGGGGGSSGGARSREVSFTVDGTTTYGTLEVPAHRDGQRLAAALLLAGSGPTDRNGDQATADVHPHTLALMADRLGRMGIMSLRFDKYFAGRTGGGAYTAHPGTIDLNAFIRQAEAAYRYLRDQSPADPHRMLVVGHSEGGMYAMLVAEGVSPAPAGLALVEPQDERILDLLDLQVNESLDASTAQGVITAGTARQNATLVRQAIAQFRAGQPVTATTGMLPDIRVVLTPLLLNPANARASRTDDAVYPPDVATRLPGHPRVLVTDGTADTNVPVSTIQPLVNGLNSAGTTGPGLRVLPHLNHYLHLPGTPDDDQVLAPDAVTALRDWALPFATSGPAR